MPRDVAVVLGEIVECIDDVLSAIAHLDRDAFERDRFVQRGVERSLEIMSEAVRHIPDDLLALRPDIPWASIRSIGNRLRHEYWRIDINVIWDATRYDLPAMREAIVGLILRQGSRSGKL